MLPWNGNHLLDAFASARHKPWTLGYENLGAERADAGPLKVEGSLPEDLKGVFYRNGPARHELGGARYSHRWDGDGMVQAFRFDGRSAYHTGRFVRTRKYVSESKAGKFLVSGFGSRLLGSPTCLDGLDSMNVANINVCHHAGRLLALWEAGSAYCLDQDSLATVGPLTLPGGAPLAPFSAHPRIDVDGVMWNFGTDPVNGVLSVYCVGSDGALIVQKRFTVDALPPMHDFAVTRDHLVFVMPPLVATKQGENLSFGQALRWSPSRPTRVLTISKLDWSFKWYELPPVVVFHIGNAWEGPNGEIHVDFMGNTEPATITLGWMVMAGAYAHVAGPRYWTVKLRPDGGMEQAVHAESEYEFPVVDPCLVGRRHQRLVCVGRSPKRAADLPGWDRIDVLDVGGGAAQSYRYGDDWLVEEHIYAPDASRPGKPAAWVVGSALNMRERATAVSIFAANSMGAGPVARVWLPYALPLGLHGTFRATSS